MGDKNINNNDFIQIDGDKDLLSAFLNQDSLHDQYMPMKNEDPYEENSKEFILLKDWVIYRKCLYFIRLSYKRIVDFLKLYLFIDVISNEIIQLR